jgi:hypothetical protein
MSARPEKIFGIGLNKTGTTSLETIFLRSGLKCGLVRSGELAWDHFSHTGDFAPLDRYLGSAEAFQDVPFSLPRFYELLAEKYGESTFILTRRETAEQWASSITNFHSRLFSQESAPPSVKDLKSSGYVRRGWIYDLLVRGLGLPPKNPYDFSALVDTYNAHNQAVRDFFAGSPRFAELIVGNESSLEHLHSVLPVTAREKMWPHENRTTSHTARLRGSPED